MVSPFLHEIRFADLAGADLIRAGEMQGDDFEDAVQAAAAERIHADRIITRAVWDFKQSRIAAFTPAGFLARV